MYKLLSLTLLTTILVFLPYTATKAGTCVAATSCDRQPIQFKPGEWISIEVVNLTGAVIEIQQMYVSEPIAIAPGQVWHFVNSGNTQPNFSLFFWHSLGLSLKVSLQQPNVKTLRLELRANPNPPGDRSIYLGNDGRVQIF